jgi:cytochrome P450
MPTETERPAFPAPRVDPLDPPPIYTRWRSDQPVLRAELRTGEHAWLATRFEDVRTVLQDQRFSADATLPGFPLLRPGLQRSGRSTFIRMDPPEHTRQRRMLTREFMIKRVEQLRPDIERIVERFLDEMDGATPPVDLVPTLALPVPSLVICLLLGVPYEDHDFFQRCSREMVDLSRPGDAVMAARDRLRDYLAELVAAKRHSPGDDLISRLVTVREADGELDREQIISIALLLLVAGHETTANMIALGTLTLLRHPEQLAALRGDPALAPAAVEELLRYLSVVHQGVPRLALEDVTLGDVTVRAGEGVLAVLPSANRDPAVFPEPDRLDLHRDAHQHVAFGYGAHQCLGQPLARVELQAVFTRLFERFPTLRLAGTGTDLRYRDDMVVYGVHRLDVTW